MTISTLQYRYPSLYKNFMNYPLEIKECIGGDDTEVLDWFRTINTAGERLTAQELRNANYTGPWLLDAKRYFSKYRKNAAETAAEKIGKNYYNKKLRSERQEVLELALQWITNSTDDKDIIAYMAAHQNDSNANELYRYFKEVIDWAKDCFPEGMSAEDSRSIRWGELYATYKDEEYDPEILMTRWQEAKTGHNNKEHNATNHKMAIYCFTGNEQDLNLRAFDRGMKETVYQLQNGKCGRCGKAIKGDTTVTLVKSKQLVIKYALCDTCKRSFLKWLYKRGEYHEKVQGIHQV